MSGPERRRQAEQRRERNRRRTTERRLEQAARRTRQRRRDEGERRRRSAGVTISINGVPVDHELPPTPDRSGPWRRRYRLRIMSGMHSSSVIMSDDAPMSDPEVQRFWIGLNLIVILIAALAGALALLAWLT